MRRTSSFTSLLTLALALVSSALASSAPALAQGEDQRSADETPLSTFSRAERELLAPELERGPVLLARFYDQHSDMPAITLASYIEAPASEVAEVIGAPATYPGFMPALDSVDIQSESAQQTAYSWTWQLAVFTLQGESVMTRYGGNERRGYRFDVRATRGDLGNGRFLWRVHPAGENRSLVVLSGRTDMRGANFVADQLARGGRSVQRSINIAMSMVMLMGCKREAEERVGFVAEPSEAPELARRHPDPARFNGLLDQGHIVFLSTRGQHLDQVSLLGRSGRDETITQRIMSDPEEFGSALIAGSHAEVIEETDDGAVFEWGIPLPLVGVEGQMVLREEEGVYSVDGRSGSLSSSRWRFATNPRGAGDTTITGWSQYDMRETSSLFRSIIGDDWAFAHGLAAATQVMVIRSLRASARRARS